MALPILDVPTYELTLPSTGKQITFRPFLVKEHKILMTLAEAEESEVSRVITDLVDVCTFKKLNARDLPHFDIEYIFMNLRAKSISETVEVVVTCLNCTKEYDTFFSIDNLKVEVPNNHNTKILLTNTVGIEMKYPKFDNVIKVFGSDDIEDVFDMVKKSVKGIFDNEGYWDASEQSDEDIESFLLQLTKDQFDKIENFFTSSPKIVQLIESKCNHCGHENTSRIEGLQNFFV